MATGTNFQLVFGPGTWGFNSDANRDCDFDKEPGKVRRFFFRFFCLAKTTVGVSALHGLGRVDFGNGHDLRGDKDEKWRPPRQENCGRLALSSLLFGSNDTGLVSMRRIHHQENYGRSLRKAGPRLGRRRGQTRELYGFMGQLSKKKSKKNGG